MQKKTGGVEAIIFDLGGVILDIDYQRTVDAFKSLGYGDFDAQYGKMKQSGLFDALETGSIEPAEFRAAVRQAIPDASDRQIDDAWNAIILDFPEGRLDYILSLKERMPVFLLSNTNAIHVRSFYGLLKERFGQSTLEPYFHQLYLSHEVGMRKPNPRIFEHVLNEQGLKANTTLFIDDSPQHIESAQTLGIQTLHLTSIHALEAELTPILA